MEQCSREHSESKGHRRFLKGQDTWVFQNCLTRQLSVPGQGATLCRFLTQEASSKFSGWIFCQYHCTNQYVNQTCKLYNVLCHLLPSQTMFASLPASQFAWRVTEGFPNMHCSQYYLGLASDPGLDEHFAPFFSVSQFYDFCLIRETQFCFIWRAL